MDDGSTGSLRVTFVDTVESSTSLRIAGLAVSDRLQRAIDSDLVVSPTDPPVDPRGRIRKPVSLERGSAVVVSYLANFLGRAGYLVPGLQTDRLRVLFVGWEIEQLTTQLRAELAGADVVLGMSGFISDVYRRRLPGTPVVTALAVPGMPSGITADRARFGLPADQVLFLYVFDPVSAFDRKNPADVYRAFQLAFPDRHDVRLVFKVHGRIDGAAAATGVEGERDRSAEFLEVVRADGRVTLINERMSYEDVMRLVASCDAYVSLSRAEGIGLPVLEAMTLGVPVVCTAYSGHLDFTTPDSALLVPVTLVDIPEGASHHYQPDKYDEAPRWADPDIEVAAAHLRLLADDPDARRAWGERAAAQAARFRAHCDEHPWVDELVDALSSPEVAAHHAERQRAYLGATSADIAEWQAHARRVYWARLRLRARTRLGRAKRALFATLGRAAKTRR